VYLNSKDNPELSETIIKNQQVVGVSFTGNTENGRTIASLAGKYIKKTSMFLSTNDNLIVL